MQGKGPRLSWSHWSNFECTREFELVSIKRAIFQIFYGLGRENVGLQFHSLRQPPYALATEAAEMVHKHGAMIESPNVGPVQ